MWKNLKTCKNFVNLKKELDIQKKFGKVLISVYFLGDYGNLKKNLKLKKNWKFGGKFRKSETGN